MRWAIPVLFSALFLHAGGATAEDHSVESAAECQRVCEAALDDLLKGNISAQDELEKIAPKEKVLGLLLHFRKMFEREEASWGKPVDWRPVGVKKIGDFFHKYVYVCRYECVPIFWEFTAIQKEGRWSLSRVQWTGTHDFLSAIQAYGVDENETYLPLCSRVANLLAHGDSQAFDVVGENWVSSAPSYRRKLEAMSKTHLADYPSDQELVECQPVYTKSTAGCLAECCYVAQFETVYSIYRFTLYRAETDWKFIGFHCLGDEDALFASVSLVPSEDSAKTLTARSPGEGDNGAASTELR